MLLIEELEEEIPVYDITIKDNHNFYANGILIHNCAEITLPTKPVTGKPSVEMKRIKVKKEDLDQFMELKGSSALFPKSK